MVQTRTWVLEVQEAAEMRQTTLEATQMHRVCTQMCKAFAENVQSSIVTSIEDGDGDGDRQGDDDGENGTMSCGTVDSTRVEGTHLTGENECVRQHQRSGILDLPVSSGPPTHPSEHPY